MVARVLSIVLGAAIILGALFLSPSPSADAARGGQENVVICHRSHDNDNGDLMFHTITVAASAVKAHQKHGDTLGPCVTVSPSPSPQAISPAVLSDMAERTLAGARS